MRKSRKDRLRADVDCWSACIVGEPKRIALVAADLIAHYDKRVEAMDGKAMVVCMSGRIAVQLYNAIIALRPDGLVPKMTTTSKQEKGKQCVVKVGHDRRCR